jgi:hypothetical protein
VDQIFRVPLHTQGKGMAWRLDGFNQTIWGNGRHYQFGGQAPNPLMVQAVNLGLGLA